jgi:hypothetical protein
MVVSAQNMKAGDDALLKHIESVGTKHNKGTKTVSERLHASNLYKYETRNRRVAAPSLCVVFSSSADETSKKREKKLRIMLTNACGIQVHI